MALDVTWSKLTDLNLERDGWRIVTIGDYGKSGAKSVVNGPFGSDLLTSELMDEGVPVIYSGDVRPGVYSRKKVAKSFVTEEKAALLSAFQTKTNDVIIAKVGDPPGNSAVYREPQDAVVTQDVIRIRPSSSVDPGFLSAVLNSDIGRRQVHRIMISGTRGRVSLTDFKKMKLPVAPLPEQRKIAEILSTWDRAIETTEVLLANARAQKRALMQTLLTGKRRFPEFEGQEWREVRLGDVGTVSSAGVDKKTDPNQPEVRLLNFLDVFRREFIFDNELDHVVTAPPAKVEQCNIRRGDVFFTPSSETRDEIAIPAVAAEDMPGVCYSYHVVRFRLKEDWDLNFRAYVFQTFDFRRQAYLLGDGSGQRYVISQNNFRQMVVRVPGLAEQKKIGAVLKAASDEVGRLKSDIEKLRAEKKALMQQLLTGKRRVRV